MAGNDKINIDVTPDEWATIQSIRKACNAGGRKYKAALLDCGVLAKLKPDEVRLINALRGMVNDTGGDYRVDIERKNGQQPSGPYWLIRPYKKAIKA